MTLAPFWFALRHDRWIAVGCGEKTVPIPRGGRRRGNSVQCLRQVENDDLMPFKKREEIGRRNRKCRRYPGTKRM